MKLELMLALEAEEVVKHGRDILGLHSLHGLDDLMEIGSMEPFTAARGRQGLEIVLVNNPQVVGQGRREVMAACLLERSYDPFLGLVARAAGGR